MRDMTGHSLTLRGRRPEDDLPESVTIVLEGEDLGSAPICGFDTDGDTAFLSDRIPTEAQEKFVHAAKAMYDAWETEQRVTA